MRCTRLQKSRSPTMSDTAFKIGLLVLGVCGAAGTWFRAWVAWRTYTGQPNVVTVLSATDSATSCQAREIVRDVSAVEGDDEGRGDQGDGSRGTG